MGITTVISSSNYPKNIYNMPLFEKELKKNLNLNSNSNLNLNRKRNKRKRKKKKEKGGSPEALGLASADRPSSPSLAQVARAHSVDLLARRQRTRAEPTVDQAQPSLHGPGAPRPASISETRRASTEEQ